MLNAKELLPFTQNLSLLFVEDHTELRQSTAEVLKNFFKEVVTASDGEKALALYKQHQESSKEFDIVLTDIQMPHMNGIELTEQIYLLNKEQSIIVLSAYDETQYLLPLINLGIEQFIKKPIDFQELLRVFLEVSKKITLTTIQTKQEKKVSLSDNLFYDYDAKSLIQEDETSYLTKYETIFLEILLHTPEKIITTDEIVLQFHALQQEIDPQNIRKLVSKLRKKLPQNSLESIYGIGYKIVPFSSK